MDEIESEFLLNFTNKVETAKENFKFWKTRSEELINKQNLVDNLNLLQFQKKLNEDLEVPIETVNPKESVKFELVKIIYSDSQTKEEITSEFEQGSFARQELELRLALKFNDFTQAKCQDIIANWKDFSLKMEFHRLFKG